MLGSAPAAMQLRFDPVLPVLAADAALLGRFSSESEWPCHFERGVGAAWRVAAADPVDAVGTAILREEAAAP